GELRIGNSDIGMAVQPNNQGAIPFINCRDTSLDPNSASVEVTNYNLRHREGPISGKLDGDGRYFSFRRASALRNFVTFDPGEEVSISLSRKKVKVHDDCLVLILESDKRQIVIEVPVKPSYSRMDVDYRAHRVVSSVLPKTEVKASIPEYLRSAAVLLPLDEMVGFPSLNRAISCSS
ncbi:MAG: hypothetical protein GYA55_13210, partial [SAR324 cluster bacterium]|nr:hypothetical protein [SAR324 cluster bacterium]